MNTLLFLFNIFDFILFYNYLRDILSYIYLFICFNYKIYMYFIYIYIYIYIYLLL